VISCSSSFIYFQRVAFKALGMLIFEVGLMLAYHCDQYGKTGSTILFGFRLEWSMAFTGLSISFE